MSIAINGVSCGKSKLISQPIWIRIVVLTGLPDHHPAKARAVAAVQKRSSHGPARFTSELETVDGRRLTQARQIMPLAVGRFSWFISLATIGGNESWLKVR
ncbi:hypothetical protein [Mesorhizobium temperatum]|uniref:hypothetical protein n=1 Tax=Mesorhizobium temperatum TaxID=241416 RepID=UPI00142DED3A|nr:hypothetical protein [Mesorhizobium temperatum]